MLLLGLSWWYSGDMLGKIIGVSMVTAAAMLWVMFQVTTPSTAGPLGVLFIFILLYMLVLGVLTFLLLGVNWVYLRLIKLVLPKKQVRPLTFVRSYYFSSILALAPVILMGMQSVGGASTYDILLVLLFVGVACFYVSKRTL